MRIPKLWRKHALGAIEKSTAEPLRQTGAIAEEFDNSLEQNERAAGDGAAYLALTLTV